MSDERLKTLKKGDVLKTTLRDIEVDKVEGEQIFGWMCRVTSHQHECYTRIPVSQVVEWPPAPKAEPGVRYRCLVEHTPDDHDFENGVGDEAIGMADGTLCVTFDTETDGGTLAIVQSFDPSQWEKVS